MSMADWSLKRDFDVGQIAVVRRHLAGAAEQPVHQRQRQPRRDDEQAGAFQRLGFEQRDVARIGQRSR